MLDIKGIKFDEYKSFSTDNKINNIKKVNVFIGKNNSGKSSCLDVIEYIINENQNLKIIPKNIFICQKLTNIVLQQVFRKSHYFVSPNNNESVLEYGMEFNNRDFWYSFSRQESNSFKDNSVSYCHKMNNFEMGEARKNDWDSVAWALIRDIENFKVFKISAERNIYPENDDCNIVKSTGEGVTAKISSYLNNSTMDERLIEETLLNDLNHILFPDSEYTGIKVQKIEIGDDSKWELYLKENSNRYALSKMGSGLKTIVMVLLYLIVLRKEANNKCIFLFEELENNLHPSLQRRLFNYIYDIATKEDLTIFLTTHSHIAINVFYGKENASIYHIEKRNYISKISEVDSYIDKVAILDDLDVKASDLFQSNGIIWVEGPSDRIYIRKWLEINNSDLLENVHYQFAYYGGKNLYHYTTDQEMTELINILLTNRNSAIVIDSDKNDESCKINETKLRIQQEFSNKGLCCWITKGKEIENYITKKDINLIYNTNKQNIGLYEKFPDYIKEKEKNFSNEKVKVAKKLVACMNDESLDSYDLKSKINELSNEIKKWNNIN